MRSALYEIHMVRAPEAAPPKAWTDLTAPPGPGHSEGAPESSRFPEPAPHSAPLQRQGTSIRNWIRGLPDSRALNWAATSSTGGPIVAKAHPELARRGAGLSAPLLGREPRRAVFSCPRRPLRPSFGYGPAEVLRARRVPPARVLASKARDNGEIDFPAFKPRTARGRTPRSGSRDQRSRGPGGGRVRAGLRRRCEPLGDRRWAAGTSGAGWRRD